MADAAKVDSPVAAHAEMAKRWELPDDLLGGTRAMRDAGAKWMPQEEKEDDDRYKRRLARSFLHPGYENGRDRLSSRPFAKPVAVKGELPERLKPLLQNVDGLGSNLTTYAHGLMREAIHRGLAHVLVDLPRNPERRAPADPKAPRLVPYFRTVSAKDLIGWRGTASDLSQIRFRDSRMEESGDWGETRVDEVRVYEPKRSRLFVRRGDEKDFAPAAGGETDVTLGKVPLVTCNLVAPGTMCGKPALETLAWLNLRHWISLSDQQNCLRFARLAMLFFAGVSKQEADAIVPGPAGLFTSTNPDAKGGFIEHGGKAMEIGRTDLQDVEAAMAVLALDPMLQQTGNPTATAKAIDEANVQSNLLAWVRLVEQTLESSFRLAAEWMQVDLPSDFSIDVHEDVGLTLRAEWEVRSIIDLWAKKGLTSKQMLHEMKRRGLLGDDLDVDAEVDAIGNMPPDLAGLGALFGPRPAAAPAA